MAKYATYTRIFYFLFLSFNGCIVFSQNLKDTLHLPQVEVRASFTQHNEGFKKIRIDSNILVQYLSTDLSTLLQQHSTIFIKSYGNGSLSTPSFRGTSANHTQVEWNGININSPMLGQTDLSQIPLSQFESLEILYGAATVARTSGAFGGVINLVSNPDWNNTANIMLAETFASFNNYTTNANLAVGNHKIQSITKFNYSNAENNFLYHNDVTGNYEKLFNDVYILGGLTEEAFLKLSSTDVISARMWYSDNFHQLPPITTNTSNVHIENLKDQDIRSLIEWRHSSDKYYFIVRSSLVDEYMLYTLGDTSSPSHSYEWCNRVRLVYTGFKNFVIRPGVDFTSDWVVSPDYEGMKTRKTLSFYSEVNYNLKDFLEFSFVFRQEMIDGKFLPFIPALGCEYKPFRKINLTLSTNLCRNYQVPTLNDLYWKAYGNDTLKPETDYSLEAGLVYNTGHADDRYFLETTLTGYYSRIINEIQWKPDSYGHWKPKNLNEALARGIELGLNLAWNLSKFRFSFSNAYNYCRSTNENTLSPNDESKGKQLIYVPLHTFNTTLMVKRSGYYASYNFQYIGKRFTSPDDLSYMPGYSLSNIILGKNFHLKKFTLSLQFNFNNLFDLDYQSIVNRPMPGRNYALTLKCNFSK